MSDARIVTRTEHNAATSQRDHGGGPPKEVENITDRPNDLKIEERKPALANSTMAERAKARAKQVKGEDAEDKAVSSAATKRARK